MYEMNPLTPTQSMATTAPTFCFPRRPLQGNCIHTPRGGYSRSTAAAPGRRAAGAPAPGSGTSTAAAASAAEAQSRAWGDILAVFDELLGVLRDANVPKPLVRALFRQLFSFVNVQLFNQLLLRRECCSFSNGEYVKTGLAQVSRRMTCRYAYTHTHIDTFMHKRQHMNAHTVTDIP